MSQVDFYLIENEVMDAQIKLCCRLANKLFKLGDHRVAILCGSAEQATRLDQLMWSYEDTSFLPHQIQGNKTIGEAPENRQIDIFVHDASEQQEAPDNAFSQYGVLVNLTSTSIETAHYQPNNSLRIAEVIEKDESARQSARQRYRDYQANGLEIKTHQLKI